MTQLSVLLPVHNGMPWLPDAVDSILRQTWKDFEFLVIDDGSTDRTSDYLNSLSDSRLNVIRFQKNKGIVAALNHGIEISQGELIARMDADDLARPERLKKQVTFMKLHPDYVGLATSIKTFSHDPAFPESELTRFETWYNTALDEQEIIQTLPIGNCLCHPSIIFRRNAVIEAGLYREEYRYAEDYDLFLRLLPLGKLGKLPDVLLDYRIHGSQISCIFNERQRQVDARIKADLLSRTIPPERPVILWGAGNGGRLIADALQRLDRPPVGMIDRNRELWGTSFQSIPVLGDASILSDHQSSFIVVATTPGRNEALHWLGEHHGQAFSDFLAVW